MRIVVALGGNALLRRGELADATTQTAHLAEAAPALAAVAAEHEVVIVHGNGPQVGLLANENEADASLTSPYPLSDLVAETQGLIGSWIQVALERAGLEKEIVVLVSRTEVDPSDPGFRFPSKFIGPSLSADQARRAREHGHSVAKDGSTWRHVVPSPAPVTVLETSRAARLLEGGCTVVLGGGGGIPVIGHGRERAVVDAVVDKDLVAARIAEDLGAELLVILTDVEGVMRDFGTPSQELIRSVSAGQLVPGDYSAGSMGPKVQAVTQFTSRTGHRSAIGALDQLSGLVAGVSGTQLTPARAAEPA